MYAKIINEETKQVSVGIGTDTEFYRSIGMSEREVEQGWDGQYYLAGYAPEKPTEQKEADVRSVRNQYLEQTDKYMITDYPITDDERELCKQYREYLRIYTEANLWYESNPFTFDEWKKLTRVTDTEDLYEQKAMTFDEWKQISELEQIVASGD